MVNQEPKIFFFFFKSTCGRYHKYTGGVLRLFIPHSTLYTMHTVPIQPCESNVKTRSTLLYICISTFLLQIQKNETAEKKTHTLIWLIKCDSITFSLRGDDKIVAIELVLSLFLFFFLFAIFKLELFSAIWICAWCMCYFVSFQW